MEGDIRYAKQDGVCVLKLIGDIRYTTGPAAVISRSLDTFFDKLFATGGFQDVVVDMTETTAIDSTNLGLLARLYTWMEEHGGRKPTLVSTNPDVTRTLESVGFDKVFNVVGERLAATGELTKLPLVEGTQREMLQLILEAHRRLMEMSEDNAEMFAPAVALMDAELHRDR
ncbi:MAG: STAS domain-containing protein [Myxococcota bacterium]